ncbi:low temperature requirement protein A [Micromonospora costi]|uniref:Low temperature requirement protein A n=1 Tax=Micromonospora costi TaxID=1530042 RepID=A0A3A9ZRG0_9ACTN|nr:low temperature requirement protein A [Micromonospora costi]RKN50156.1 low temperature requirement protein A [Micromonospora costi]
MARTEVERLIRDSGQPREITFVELFFDLAIIFALMQLSRRFLHDFGWENSLQTLVLLAAVWWLWVGAARTTDWLDPDEPFVQRIVIGMMFAGLVAAAAVPEAFGEHGIVFAGANVAAHLVRHLSIVAVLHGHPPAARSARAATWFGATAPLWIAGAFLPATPRLALWSVAVALDYVGVGIGWRVPGLPLLREQHLRVQGDHFAERHRQVFIIALGEVVLASGIALSKTDLDIVRVGAFALAFAIAGLMARAFFLPRGLPLRDALDRRPASAAIRASYTYLIMVVGIVVTAMGAEILISEPLGEARAVWSAAVLAGPFLYLAGRALYARALFQRRPWRAGVGMLVIAAVSPAMVRLPPLAVGGAVGAVLIGVVLSYGRIGPEPVRAGTPLERLTRKRKDPRELSAYELFFDLAMIFALARVSQRALADLSLVNVAESLVLLAAIYWVWVATAWSTDWFNPDEPRLQRLIIVIMFAGLLMAAAVPTAFGDHGLLFAGAYAGIHIVRGLVLVPVLRGSPLQARSARVLVWFSVSAVLWLVGAFLPVPGRLALWAAAIVVDGASAWFGWPVPKLRAPSAHLKVIGDHIAERYRQIHIIALGALVVLSGQAYSSAGFDYVRTLAFAVAFASATVMLWNYFLPSGRDLGTAVNTGAPRIAVAAAYCHGIMVAGTVAVAVGAELTIRQPLGRANAVWSLVIMGGIALHIVGRTLLGVVLYGVHRPWRGTLALLVIAGMAPGLLRAPPLVVALATVVVAFLLTLSYRNVVVPAQQPGP